MSSITYIVPPYIIKNTNENGLVDNQNIDIFKIIFLLPMASIFLSPLSSIANFKAADYYYDLLQFENIRK